MEAAWGVKNLPDWVGLTMTDMLPAISKGDIKALYIIGENPVLTDPDSDHADQGHASSWISWSCQDIFLTETGKLADVVLPASSFAEKDGTFSNTERRVARVRQAIPPVGKASPTGRSSARSRNRLGYPMNYANPEAIFEEIRQVTPVLCRHLLPRLEAGGLQWPCPNEEHPGTVYLHKDRFAKGKGTFFAIDHKDPAEMPDAEYPARISPPAASCTSTIPAP